ncbi:MAG: ATP-binding protein [Acidobacteriota bacterium]
MRAPVHIEMSLNSRVDLTNLVHAACDEVCRLAGLDEDGTMNLGLALREATVNAMRHGNKLCEKKPVRIAFDLTPTRLSVTIIDQGNGFDFEKEEDPRLPENLGKTSGRGIFLMRHFVDDLRFRHIPGEGTAVSLIKKLPRRNGARSSSR